MSRYTIPKRYKAGPNATSSTGGRPGYGGPGCDSGTCWPYSWGGYFYRTAADMHWYQYGRWVLLAFAILFVLCYIGFQFFKYWRKRRANPKILGEIQGFSSDDYANRTNQEENFGNKYTPEPQEDHQNQQGGYNQDISEAPPQYQETKAPERVNTA